MDLALAVVVGLALGSFLVAWPRRLHGPAARAVLDALSRWGSAPEDLIHMRVGFILGGRGISRRNVRLILSKLERLGLVWLDDDRDSEHSVKCYMLSFRGRRFLEGR